MGDSVKAVRLIRLRGCVAASLVLIRPGPWHPETLRGGISGAHPHLCPQHHTGSPCQGLNATMTLTRGLSTWHPPLKWNNGIGPGQGSHGRHPQNLHPDGSVDHLGTLPLDCSHWNSNTYPFSRGTFGSWGSIPPGQTLER